MQVSIIIPCYNVAPYIAACLRSVEEQTYDQIEVICVNDGSTDGTLGILENFKVQTNLPFKIINQINKGAPAARNAGVRESTGDYFQFLDADDLLLPAKIAAQMALAKNKDWPDLVVGSFERQNMAGDVLETKHACLMQEDAVWLNLMATEMGITSSNLFKASAFKNGLAWNEALNSSQEYDLMFQLLQKGGSVVFDAGIYTIVRTRPFGSISQTNIGKKWIQHTSLKAELMSYLRGYHPMELNLDMNQSFFESVRMLYPHCPKEALHLYQLHLPADFKPKVSLINGKLYVLLFKLVGFKNTESLRLLFKRSVAK